MHTCLKNITIDNNKIKIIEIADSICNEILSYNNKLKYYLWSTKFTYNSFFCQQKSSRKSKMCCTIGTGFYRR